MACHSVYFVTSVYSLHHLASSCMGVLFHTVHAVFAKSHSSSVCIIQYQFYGVRTNCIFHCCYHQPQALVCFTMQIVVTAKLVLHILLGGGRTFWEHSTQTSSETWVMSKLNEAYICTPGQCVTAINH